MLLLLLLMSLDVESVSAFSRTITALMSSPNHVHYQNDVKHSSTSTKGRRTGDGEQLRRFNNKMWDDMIRFGRAKNKRKSDADEVPSDNRVPATGTSYHH